jgi:hypothetical protein
MCSDLGRHDLTLRDQVRLVRSWLISLRASDAVRPPVPDVPSLLADEAAASRAAAGAPERVLSRR